MKPRIVLLFALAVSHRNAAAQAVTLVDVVPLSQSEEQFQNSEPSIAVDPLNLNVIAVSAFAPALFNPLQLAQEPHEEIDYFTPIYKSGDGGITWSVIPMVPSPAPPLSSAHDISLAFAASDLYIGILSSLGTVGIMGVDWPLMIYRLRGHLNAYPALSPLLVPDCHLDGISSVICPDQPWVKTDNVNTVLITANTYEMEAERRRPVVFETFNSQAFLPSFESVLITARASAHDRDTRPPVRASVGWANAYVAAELLDGVGGHSPVVFADANGGAGPTYYEDLTDPSVAGLVGSTVVPPVSIPISMHTDPPTAFMGQDRIGSDLAIATGIGQLHGNGPPHLEVTYIAWADKKDGDGSVKVTLHLRHSYNGGLTWCRLETPANATNPSCPDDPVGGSDLLTIHEAKNPAIAVNCDGDVGFLYQQLTGPFQGEGTTGAGQQWETHFRLSHDEGVAAWSDVLLVRTPADFPARANFPYLGDYVRLEAQCDFVGTFSASNDPNPAHFPTVAPSFLRRMANGHPVDLEGVEVPVSIDPYVFRVARSAP